MANMPGRFNAPPRCKLCGAEGSVVLETTITQGSARQTWCCRACGGEWPITRSEQDVIEDRAMQPRSTKDSPSL